MDDMTDSMLDIVRDMQNPSHERSWRVAMDMRGHFEIMDKLDADHDHIICHDILETDLKGLNRILADFS